MNNNKRKALYCGIGILILVSLFYFLSGTILSFFGEFLVCDEKPVPSDAVVVLSTGMAYYPRLMEAADLYRKKFAKKIVINGNRKTEALRSLEKLGLEPCCVWYEGSFRMLDLLGVSKEDIIAVSAENAYDTVSEAKAVGREIIMAGVKSIIVTTSKSHTLRAGYIWKSLYKNRLKIITVAAKSDPYLPEGWWKSGRQIKWVLSEYGAFLYLLWKKSGWIEDRPVLKDDAVGLNSDGLMRSFGFNSPLLAALKWSIP
jgi:uncharacterized SAM-binding protein YcdF (DUF218 family)